MDHRVGMFKCRPSLREAVRCALDWAGVEARLTSGTRVAVKPNLTYPRPELGVTTSLDVLEEVVAQLQERGATVAVVESDGGNRAWTAEEAFHGHAIDKLAERLSFDLVNLSKEPRTTIVVRSGVIRRKLPLPTRLVSETDLFISMPVPKVHCMTGVSLSMKNQWGCIPDSMRMRFHHVFDDAIVAINKHLRPVVVADGTWFLDRNGPMFGEPVRMDLIIGATSAWAFDTALVGFMGMDWRQVPHFRTAHAAGLMPTEPGAIRINDGDEWQANRTFRLERSLRNHVALAAFRSRMLTWLGYESWFGKQVLHSILYAVVGRPWRATREQ